MSRLPIPLPPMSRYSLAAFPADLVAAVTVLFLAVPQGLAYATIAGLPPAVGLYAATVPTIVSSLLRSSSHVISGPTNALSLLVGAAVATDLGADPVEIALTLALMVGLMQALAGALRPGAILDFISSAVVLGYITGAGILIAIGQLYNATGTSGARGKIWVTVGGWIETLAETQPLAVAVSLGTVGIVIGIRALNARTGKRLPSAIVAMVLALTLNLGLGLESQGLQVVSDLAEIPAGLPPLTLPNLRLMPELLAVAVACTVLSLVESSSVARSIASRTGQRLEPSTEFFGQGLSNIAAAFFGGYPVSGSLSRSALNERVGAKTRVAGVVSGSLMLVVLLAFGPLLNHTPTASLAGLMFVVGYDLVDVPKIRRVMGTSRADAAAFATTMLGTWLLSIDLAIYLGVGISLLLFLARARTVRVVELTPDASGLLQESPLGADAVDRQCRRVRIVDVEGPLFFGAAGGLGDALASAVEDRVVRVLVVRLRRAKGLDATTAAVLENLAAQLAREGRHLILVGIAPGDLRVLQRSGATDAFGRDCLFPSRPNRFLATQAGLARARQLCDTPCENCPLAQVAADLPEGRSAPPEKSSESLDSFVA